MSMGVAERDTMKSMVIVIGLPIILTLMLLFILLLLFLACKPWRYLPSSFFRSNRTLPCNRKVDEIERPLVTGDVQIQDQSDESTRDYGLEGSCIQTENYLSPPRTEGLVHKQRLASASPFSAKGDSIVLDVINDPPDDIHLGQTFQQNLAPNHTAEALRHGRKEAADHSLHGSVENERIQEFVPKDITNQTSCLTLDVISGPSFGLQCSVQSNSSKLPLTLGRVAPSDIQLKDSEVSGKHAMINWNLNRMKWELVDMGSLNGTLLNSNPVNHPDSGSRRWGDPAELASGDTITLGTASKVSVQISTPVEDRTPFRISMVSDPMAVRRGGKKLAMEDVCYCHWPLPGASQFGLFGICDGHGGVAAAESARKILPELVASMLSDSVRRERVLSQCDASDVLRDAISQTEASMRNYYEGCTATVLLIWVDGDDNFYAQCANVGDSACIVNFASGFLHCLIIHVVGKSVDGDLIKMTEDHRVVSHAERQRIQETGEPLRDGETRLSGLNLARTLGDKFLKQQDARLSSEPYVSQVVCIDQASSGFAIMASDGLWDVISAKKANQLILQARDRYYTEGQYSADKIANFLLSEARSLRTKDNTSLIFLDFDRNIKTSCKVDS